MMQNFQHKSSSPSSAHIDQRHVLIVDDDPVFRVSTSAFLTHQGYIVNEAGNGLEGLQQLSDNVPDLVLCDLAMPILDGIEFVEEIQSQYPSLPIIVVSATEQMSEVAKALRFGIKDFLAKPIANYQHLLSAIDNTLMDTTNLLATQRDFAGQWYRVDEEGEIPEEEELYWHLDHLQNNPASACELLHALLPEKETSQGSWKCQYRVLQSSETMPLVFDYAWVMDGQFVFYAVDSNSIANSVGTVLLVRALFDDYLRHVRTTNVDLKTIVEMVEKGLNCSEHIPAVNALFGVADFSSGVASILPAGLESRWLQGDTNMTIPGGNKLGERSDGNLLVTDLQIAEHSQMKISIVGSCSFHLDLEKVNLL